MKETVEEIIKKKPHLANPFRFYERVVKFTNSIHHLCLKVHPERNSYPRESVDKIFDIFSNVFELPEGTLAPLKQAMELNEIDFARIPLNEAPAFSLPYPEDDLTMLLFLISKPYFLSLRESVNLDNRRWDERKCPACNAQPAVSWIGDEGQRRLFCSFCGTVGNIVSPGCAICGNNDGPQQNVISFEGEEGFRINTCDACRSYVKTIETNILFRMDPEVADLMSLPLDIVVQEKGFQRRSPNPIGMRKISVHG